MTTDRIAARHPSWRWGYEPGHPRQYRVIVFGIQLFFFANLKHLKNIHQTIKSGQKPGEGVQLKTWFCVFSHSNAKPLMELKI